MDYPSQGSRTRNRLLSVLLGVVFASLAGCSDSPDDLRTLASLAKAPIKTLPERVFEGPCSGAVAPCIATIESGRYTPLARPLLMYVNRAALKRPEVLAYLRFVLNEGQDLVSLVQYIRLNADSLEEARRALEEAAVGVELPQKIQGKLKIDGSSTVFPIAQAAAEFFIEQHPEVLPQVGKSGTGGGFKKFVLGETDISNASRPISSTEIEECRKHNVEFLELKVAIDGLAVVVNPENSFCECLTVEQLKKVWEPGSSVTRWNELNPDWPPEEIKLYGPDTDSGTFDYFTEVICGKSKAARSDYISSSEDNVLVKGVEGDRFSLGYFGYAYYAENAHSLKVVGIHPPPPKSKSESQHK